MDNVFDYLAKQLLLSLAIFLSAAFLILKLYETFLSQRMHKKFMLLRDREKEIPFEIFLIGGLLLGVCLLLKMKYAVPFIWFLCSGSLLLGGALGLIPFSFIDKKRSK